MVNMSGQIGDGRQHSQCDIVFVTRSLYPFLNSNLGNEVVVS